MRILAIVLLALFPATAAAQVSPGPTDAVDGAVTAGGTTVAAWVNYPMQTTPGTVTVKIGDAAPVAVARGVEPLGAARGSRFAVAWGDEVAVGDEATGLGPAETVTGGGVVDLEINERGDVAVLLQAVVYPRTTPGLITRTAFRPAGGTFGAPVDLPGTPPRREAMALGPDGATLFASTSSGGLSAVTRSGDGPLGAPVPISTSVSRPAVALDSQGRALAAWSAADGVRVASRVGGAWGGATKLSDDAHADLRAGLGEDGTTAVAWRTQSGMARYAIGSLVSPTGAEGAVSARAVTTAPELAVSPGGTVRVAATEAASRILYVVERTPGEPPRAEPSGCAAKRSDISVSAGAVFFRAMRTTALTLGAPLFGRSPVFTGCRVESQMVGGTFPAYSSSPVIAGRPVTIDVAAARKPGYTTDSVYWDLAGRYVDGPESSVTHTFTTPGRVKWTFAMRLFEEERDGEARDVVTSAQSLDVYAPAAITASGRQGRARTLAHGVAVSANAFAAAARAPVELTITRRGRLLGRRATTLGAFAERVLVPLNRAGRRRVARRTTVVNVRLVQSGAELARADVVLRGPLG